MSDGSDYTGTNITPIGGRPQPRPSEPEPAKAMIDPCLIDPPGRKHTINIRPGQIPEHADEAEKILIQHDRIFQRSANLVRVAAAKTETVNGIQRPANGTVISPVDADFLMDRMARLIVWRRWNARKEQFVASNAPRSVALSLLARSGAWAFPSLVGVITAPTLRPDGSVLEKPGYDPATGLLFVNDTEVFPTVPTQPSRAAAERSLTYLEKEVLSGFGFADEHDRSAALSAILTAVVRPTLSAAPLYGISGPKPGTGKSLLADCVALIGSGRTATVLSFTEDPEEQRKRVLSLLMSGDQVINMDNLEVPLASAALCTALTGETYTERKLGSLGNCTAPSAAMWLATGNNLIVKGDLTRRTVLINLDPACERPEEREFTRDLRQWIPQHRPALVAAALTVLRAYVVAGKPSQAKPLGSFEAWSGLVRSALLWLGQPDPLKGRDQMERDNPETAKLKALLVAWHLAFGKREVTTKEAIHEALPEYSGKDAVSKVPALYDILTDEFADRDGKLSARRLGEYLSKYKKRIEAGVCIEIVGTRDRYALWGIKVIDKSALDKYCENFSS